MFSCVIFALLNHYKLLEGTVNLMLFVYVYVHPFLGVHMIKWYLNIKLYHTMMPQSFPQILQIIKFHNMSQNHLDKSNWQSSGIL